jgi:hypothetical protein
MVCSPKRAVQRGGQTGEARADDDQVEIVCHGRSTDNGKGLNPRIMTALWLSKSKPRFGWLASGCGGLIRPND